MTGNMPVREIYSIEQIIAETERLTGSKCLS